MRLIIRGGRAKGFGNLVDIVIEDGVIEYIGEEHVEVDDDSEVIDANGYLITPTFVDPHLHLDKVFTACDGRFSESETLEESIKIMHDIKRNYTVEDVKQRAIKAIKESVRFGCTKIRANVDVDTIGGLTPLQGVLKAKEATKEIADIQIVAFPQEGIFKDPGTERLLWEAMDMGADVVGGMPAAEWSSELSKKHVDLVFEIARKYDADIDMHMDQTKDPSARSLEYTALKSMEYGYEGRVTGGHCTSLAYQDKHYAEKVMELLKLVDFNVCVNPGVLAIMGVDEEPRTRGLTRVRELVEMGINVATAQDTICDGFHLYGTGNPLDYGLLLAYGAQYNSSNTIEIVFDMITHNSARILGLKDYGLRKGAKADLNIIQAYTISEAFRLRPPVLYVIRSGRVIAKSSYLTEWVNE